MFIISFFVSYFISREHITHQGSPINNLGSTISDGCEIFKKTKKLTESKKEIIDYYKNNKGTIEKVKKHCEKIPSIFASTIEKAAKENMQR